MTGTGTGLESIRFKEPFSLKLTAFFAMNLPSSVFLPSLPVSSLSAWDDWLHPYSLYNTTTYIIQLYNTTTAGNQTMDLGNACLKYMMCENRTSLPHSDGMVAYTGNGFQLPVWCYTTCGLFIICLVFPSLPISFLDRGVLLFSTCPTCPRIREKGK